MQEMILFLQFLSIPHDKMSNRSQEIEYSKMNDFGEQNETKYNRISFLVLLRLTFEKTKENKSQKLICTNQCESKKSNYFLPARRNSVTAEER